MHEGCPWRHVVHIDTQVGPRGGESWVLRLECGHTAFRYKPNPTPDQVVARYLMPIVHLDGKRARRPKLTAPHRVRCYWCGQVSNEEEP